MMPRTTLLKRFVQCESRPFLHTSMPRRAQSSAAALLVAASHPAESSTEILADADSGPIAVRILFIARHQDFLRIYPDTRELTDSKREKKL